jgi:hypothetical protein
LSVRAPTSKSVDLGVITNIRASQNTVDKVRVVLDLMGEALLRDLHHGGSFPDSD